MSIDKNDIRPGDTVSGHIQTKAMKDLDIPPVPFGPTIVYEVDSSLRVAGYALMSNSVTVLERTPARPDWADAPFIATHHDGETQRYLRRFSGDGFIGADGEIWEDWRDLEEYGPVTVILDADGNPPAPEPEWLDADALNELPEWSVVLPEDGMPMWRDHQGYWRLLGRSPKVTAGHVAPARVLWAPGAQEDE